MKCILSMYCIIHSFLLSVFINLRSFHQYQVYGMLFLTDIFGPHIDQREHGIKVEERHFA